jgi:hypothetical protein
MLPIIARARTELRVRAKTSAKSHFAVLLAPLDKPSIGRLAILDNISFINLLPVLVSEASELMQFTTLIDDEHPVATSRRFVANCYG